MKKLFVFILLAGSVMTAQAQRFEWAKGYTVEDYMYRSIVGGVTDSMGNLYILGNCDATSVWDGIEDIIPPIHKSAKSLPNDVLIAKISTEGEMVWKKVVFGNNGRAYIPYDIKKLGDTAFACVFDFYGANDLGYQYFLDTFLVTPTNYPIDIRYFSSSYLAYLVFDFDGNVKEQHFLTITFTDADGNDIVTRYPNHVDTTPWLKGVVDFRCSSFDIDTEGNIYIGRIASDVCSGAGHLLTPNDSIRGLKFWVDRRFVGEYRIEGHPSQWFPQILKFSPHLDTLLGCRYVVQKWNNAGYDPLKTTTKVDKYGNVYIIPSYSNAVALYSADIADTIVIDSLRRLEFVHKSNNPTFLVSYDNELNTRWIITYDDSITVDNINLSLIYKRFHDIAFDYDSNLIFLSATSGRRTAFNDTMHYNSVLSYRGRPLPLKDGASIASFYNTDSIPVMHSYKVVPAILLSSIEEVYEKGTLYCKNNRVALQCVYYGGIEFPSQTIRYNTGYQTGEGLIIFDYSGNVIGGIDYGSVLDGCAHNYNGPIVAHDSVLYLCNILKTNAQFGNISFPVYGETNVIAKYVDTAFMHPYVRPTHGISTVTAVAPRVYPVPASDRLHFDCPAGVVPTAVAAISLTGWRMPLTATATTADISCLAPGAYLLEITAGKETYYARFIKR